MAKTYCKYHPKDLARKYCSHCEINLCSKCIKPESHGSVKLICPVCSNAVSDLGMENVITPFWERIPQFFKYPFSTDSMIYIVGLSLLSFLAYLPIVGFAVYIAIMFAIYRYGFALLQHTAKGYTRPEETGGGTRLNTKSNMHIILFMITILCAVLSYVVAIKLNSLTVLLVLLGLLGIFLPAIIMTVGVTESFLQSINPVRWFVIVSNIGIHYFTLLIFLIILYGSQATLFYYVAPYTKPVLLLPVSIAIFTYFFMVMFLMMGYVIYQYHERLGIEVEKDVEEGTLNRMHTAEDITKAVLQEVSILVQEGMFDEAKSKLKQALVYHSMELKLNEQYYKLLEKTQDNENLVKHAKAYVPVLIYIEEMDRAVDVVERAMELDQNFRPMAANHTLAIAQHATNKGRHKLALQVLEKFDAFYQMDSNIPKAGLLMAKVLCNGLGEDAKAQRILTAILKKYPNGSVADNMREYLKLVDSLVGKTAEAEPDAKAEKEEVVAVAATESEAKLGLELKLDLEKMPTFELELEPKAEAEAEVETEPEITMDLLEGL